MKNKSVAFAFLFVLMPIASVFADSDRNDLDRLVEKQMAKRTHGEQASNSVGQNCDSAKRSISGQINMDSPRSSGASSAASGAF